MEKVYLPVLLGTNRKLRKSIHVANWLIKEIADKRDDITTRLFDSADFDLPPDDYGTEISHLFPEWRDEMIKADGLIIVAPEYNHGYPGILKSVLDLLLKEYIHKAVGLVGVSAQVWGGTRVIEALIHPVREMGLTVIFTDLNFPRIEEKFNDDGDLLDEAYQARAKDFLDELVWMSRALKWGREHLPSKYHQK